MFVNVLFLLMRVRADFHVTFQARANKRVRCKTTSEAKNSIEKTGRKVNSARPGECDHDDGESGSGKRENERECANNSEDERVRWYELGGCSQVFRGFKSFTQPSWAQIPSA